MDTFISLKFVNVVNGNLHKIGRTPQKILKLLFGLSSNCHRHYLLAYYMESTHGIGSLLNLWNRIKIQHQFSGRFDKLKWIVYSIRDLEFLLRERAYIPSKRSCCFQFLWSTIELFFIPQLGSQNLFDGRHGLKLHFRLLIEPGTFWRISGPKTYSGADLWDEIRCDLLLQQKLILMLRKAWKAVLTIGH